MDHKRCKDDHPSPSAIRRHRRRFFVFVFVIWVSILIDPALRGGNIRHLLGSCHIHFLFLNFIRQTRGSEAFTILRDPRGERTVLIRDRRNTANSESNDIWHYCLRYVMISIGFRNFYPDYWLRLIALTHLNKSLSFPYRLFSFNANFKNRIVERLVAISVTDFSFAAIQLIYEKKKKN